MTPQLFDLVLFLILVVGLPVQGLYSFRRMVAALKAGRTHVKVRAYRNTILLQWALVVALIVVWSMNGRPLSALGLGTYTPLGAVAATACLGVGLLFVVSQQQSIAALSAERLDRLRTHMGDTLRLLPSTPAERRWFTLTALTAGICEELLYRGFMIWYLAPFAGLPGAALGSSGIFGLAHSYQGRQGIIKTAVLGLVMATFYLLSGTLWAPMVVHAAIDLSAGALARRLTVDRPM